MKTKIPVLLLCHGRAHTTTPCTSSNNISCCPTSEIDFKNKTLNLTFLDKDPRAKPHILHDWRKPIGNKFKTKFDIITTMCCDSDMFYNDLLKQIEPNSFINIANSLSDNGIFVMPKYYWMNASVLSQIIKVANLKLIKKYKTFYIMSKHI